MFIEMMGVNRSSFVKVHWLNSNVNLPRAGCLFVDVRGDFKWQFLSLMMRRKARRKIRGGVRISICVADDLFTHNLMHTHTAVCDEEWSLGILGREGIINVLRSCVIQSDAINNDTTCS